MGLMISKSLIDVGFPRDKGAADGCRGESGTPDAEVVGLRMTFAAVEWRRCPRRLGTPSFGDSIGDTGGVIWILGSSRLPADRLVLIVSVPVLGPSFKSIGGGVCCCDDATMGAANASGDDIEDGVDDLVGNLLTACQCEGVGAIAEGKVGAGGGSRGIGEGGTAVGVSSVIDERHTAERPIDGDEDAMGVGSEDCASPLNAYSEVVLE